MRRTGHPAVILELLLYAPRPLTAGEIYRYLDISEPSELSSVLVKLERKGLVSVVLVDRVALTGPRKIKRYSVTERGRQALASLYG